MPRKKKSHEYLFGDEAMFDSATVVDLDRQRATKIAREFARRYSDIKNAFNQFMEFWSGTNLGVIFGDFDEEEITEIFCEATEHRGGVCDTCIRMVQTRKKG